MVYKFTGQLLWNKKENKKIYTIEKSTPYLNGMSFFSLKSTYTLQDKHLNKRRELRRDVFFPVKYFIHLFV